jgi:hypothetical protein
VVRSSRADRAVKRRWASIAERTRRDPRSRANSPRRRAARSCSVRVIVFTPSHPSVESARKEEGENPRHAGEGGAGGDLKPDEDACDRRGEGQDRRRGARREGTYSVAADSGRQQSAHRPCRVIVRRGEAGQLRRTSTAPLCSSRSPAQKRAVFGVTAAGALLEQLVTGFAQRLELLAQRERPRLQPPQPTKTAPKRSATSTSTSKRSHTAASRVGMRYCEFRAYLGCTPNRSSSSTPGKVSAHRAQLAARRDGTNR